MSSKPRSEVFNPHEQAVVHIFNRCVRRCFLMGYDKQSQKNYGHRRKVFEGLLQNAATGFGIDLLCYAIMDNHFHLILRSRPDVVQQWSDAQIVRQWHKLCPIFKDKDGIPVEDPCSSKVDAVAQNAAKVATWRTRLSDISWYMKLVSQKFAKLCNAEDGITGTFWEARFKGKVLLDESALLACSVYVDLNRIKAELASSLETSDYTSIQRRIQTTVIQASMRKMLAEQVATAPSVSTATTVVLDVDHGDIPEAGPLTELLPDAHLSPISIDEKCDPIGPHLSTRGSRCSDKGFLPIGQAQYVELLQWTVDQLRRRHNGRSFDDSPTILAQLKLEADVWCKLVSQFSDLFFVVAGMPESIDNYRSCLTGKRFNMPQKTREMLTV